MECGGLTHVGNTTLQFQVQDGEWLSRSLRPKPKRLSSAYGVHDPAPASPPTPLPPTLLCCIALPAVGSTVLGTQEIFDPCLLNEKMSGRREAWKDGQGLSHRGLCVVSQPRNVHLEKPTLSQGIPQRTPVWGLQHSASAGMDSVL